MCVSVCVCARVCARVRVCVFLYTHIYMYSGAYSSMSALVSLQISIFEKENLILLELSGLIINKKASRLHRSKRFYLVGLTFRDVVRFDSIA